MEKLLARNVKETEKLFLNGKAVGAMKVLGLGVPDGMENVIRNAKSVRAKVTLDAKRVKEVEIYLIRKNSARGLNEELLR
jgi:hypothetical protein